MVYVIHIYSLYVLYNMYISGLQLIGYKQILNITCICSTLIKLEQILEGIANEKPVAFNLCPMAYYP